MSATAAEYNEKGNAAYQSGSYETALAFYTQAVACHGAVAKYHTNRANTLLLKLGRDAMGLEAAEAAISVDPAWIKGYFYKSLALERQGKLPQALAACQDGLAVDAKNKAFEAAMTRIQASMLAQQAKMQRVQQQQQRQQQRQQQQQQQQRQPEAPDCPGFPSGLRNDELIFPPAMMKEHDQFFDAGTLRGRDGSPHPFSWTGGLQPLEKRADWLIDCYRLRAADDAGAGAANLHGLYVPDGTADGLCEDFLLFCTLAERNGVAPAGYKRYMDDAWPGWGYLVPLAAKRLLQAFTQADAEAKWGVPDAMPAAMVPHWLQLIAAPSSKPPWGRSLRYTAQLVYGCRVGEAEPQEVKDLRARFEGKWGQVFADGRLKDQATSLLGSWQLWEEFHKAVKQAWQKSQQ